MRKLRLTAKRVQRLLKRPGRYRDDDVRGLLLVVVESTRRRQGGAKPRNTASWQLRYQLRGAEHAMGLGSVADFSLAQARERAKKARQLLADKIDPLAEKRAADAAQKLAAAKKATFREAATQFFNQHSPKWRSAKSRQQFQNSLRDHAFPILASLPVDAIDVALVLKCLEPHWLSKTVTMGRVRSRIAAVLDWAAARGLRSGANPAAWATLKHLLPAKVGRVEHFAAMPYGKIPELMAALRQREGVAAMALQFLVVTAARTSEVTGAVWSEIDLDGATWTIPAQRMKSNKEHKVALSAEAVTLLRGAYRLRDCPFVFVGPSGGGLSNMALAKELRRFEPVAVVHGFRSSFRTWSGERTSYATPIIERCLAHETGSAVELAYSRGDLLDKRRKLMQAWATYCASPPVEAGEVVVPIRSAAS
jgi:integrase